MSRCICPCPTKLDNQLNRMGGNQAGMSNGPGYSAICDPFAPAPGRNDLGYMGPEAQSMHPKMFDSQRLSQAQQQPMVVQSAGGSGERLDGPWKGGAVGGVVGPVPLKQKLPSGTVSVPSDTSFGLTDPSRGKDDLGVGFQMNEASWGLCKAAMLFCAGVFLTKKMHNVAAEIG